MVVSRVKSDKCETATLRSAETLLATSSSPSARCSKLRLCRFSSWARCGFFLLPIFSRRPLRRFRRHHLVRRPDQLPQFIPTHRVYPVKHHPLVPPHIRRRTNILALDQLGKNLRRAFETEPRIVQPQHYKNLPADFEAKLVPPLQVLRSFGKRQTKFANRVYLHGASCLSENLPIGVSADAMALFTTSSPTRKSRSFLKVRTRAHMSSAYPSKQNRASSRRVPYRIKPCLTPISHAFRSSTRKNSAPRS